MGLFDWFSSKKAPEVIQKDLSASDASMFFGDSRDRDAVFPDLNTTQQLQVMQNNVIVYACVTAKSTAFQQARLSVQEKVGKEWVDKPEHNALSMFSQNPWLSESDIEQYIQIHLNLTGKSFLWKWYNKLGDVSELWPVPPQWVEIVPTTDVNAKSRRVIDGYIIDPKDGTQPLFVPVDDMCYTRYPDPMNLYDGLSPIQVAIRSVTLDEMGENYRAEAMGSLSLPGLAITIKDKQVSQSQKDDIRAVLKQKMGMDARKSAMILNGSDIGVTVINPLEKFDWLAYTTLNEARICSVFRVPPIVISCYAGLDNAAWSQTGTALSFFYKNTMVSEWELVARSFTRWLIPEDQQATLRYYFDTAEVPQMQEDAAVQEKRIIDLYNSSIVTLNEARSIAGYPAVPNGDTVKINSATIFVPIDETIGIPASTLSMVDNAPSSLDLFEPEDNVDNRLVEDAPEE
jgi:HK97 family phage portal protein